MADRSTDRSIVSVEDAERVMRASFSDSLAWRLAHTVATEPERLAALETRALAAEAALTGWELFRPADGRPVLRVRWRWAARLITRAVPRLDYARPGEGWAR